MAIISYGRLLCRELDVAMATAFLKTCFSKFVIFVFHMKINFNTVFHIFIAFCVPFYCFSVLSGIFCDFLTFWNNFEIQDGGSKIFGHHDVIIT